MKSAGPSWTRLFAGLLTTIAMIAAMGCHAEHPQSMLHPASSPAQQIAWLWWFLLAICTFVFLVVLVLTWLAIRPVPVPSPQEVTAEENNGLGDRFIVWFGAIIPTAILIVILLVSVSTQKSLGQPETDLTIEVIGHQFWWEIHYPAQNFEIANEVRIPVGKPVRLELISADVTHSLWIPNLQGKIDLLPDRVNVTWIQADKPGSFRGQCAEYCGVQHALMAIEVVAVPEAEFQQWLEQRQQPFQAPADEQQWRGREVFVKANCHSCHSVGNHRAERKRGPDLTHLGDRRTLGAGILPNNHANLSAWISNPQTIKPGNLMPATPLKADDLQALLVYLKSLK